MKRSFLSIITLMTSLLILSACGQKGPLYLPEKQEPPIVTTEASQPNKTDTTKPIETTKTEKTGDTQ